ncbi:hypothetical protein [Metabacillus fastidiosus]|uniref:hypothetical protein n=1 Tax=Metabacillus fastidiosus TaxID=1458 RepID=UPI003D298C5A
MSKRAKEMLERIINGESKIAEGGVLMAAVVEIKKLRKENKDLENPQVWTNEGEL